MSYIYKKRFYEQHLLQINIRVKEMLNGIQKILVTKYINLYLVLLYKM